MSETRVELEAKLSRLQQTATDMNNRLGSEFQAELNKQAEANARQSVLLNFIVSEVLTGDQRLLFEIKWQEYLIAALSTALKEAEEFRRTHPASGLAVPTGPELIVPNGFKKN